MQAQGRTEEVRYAQYLKTLPEYVEARAEMAAMYRAARKQNRLVGNLLWKRMRTAEREMIRKFHSADPDAAKNIGLAALLSDR